MNINPIQPSNSQSFYLFDEQKWDLFKKEMAKRNFPVEDRSYYTPLDIAIGTSDEKKCIDLLQKGFPINERNRLGSTPLSFALSCGEEDIAILLVKKGASFQGLESFYVFGDRPLYWKGLFEDRSHFLEYLFKNHLIDPDFSFHSTLIEDAWSLKKEWAIDLIVKYSSKERITPTEDMWKSYFHSLSSLGKQFSLFIPLDKTAHTPLHLAVLRKDLPACIVLLKRGIKLNQETYPLLILALGSNSDSIISLLVENNVDIHAEVTIIQNSQFFKLPCFFFAFAFNKISLCTFLVREKWLNPCTFFSVPLPNSQEFQMMSLLEYVVYEEKAWAVEVLLDAMVSFERDALEPIFTPLWKELISKKKLPLFIYIFKNVFKRKLNIVIDGISLLKIALVQKKLEFINYLVKILKNDLLQLHITSLLSECLYYGDEVFKTFYNALEVKSINLHATNTTLSLLKDAIHLDQCHIVQFLIQKGCPVSKVINENQTPLMLTKIYQWKTRSHIHQETYKLLKVYDLGLTKEVYEISLLGHRFSLLGPLFEGSTPTYYFYRKIGKSLPMHSMDIKEAFDLPRDMESEIQRYESKKCVIVKTGWYGHGACILFKNKICVKINTGTGFNRGIHFYKILNSSPLTIKTCFTYLWNEENYDPANKEQAIQYYEEGINNVLELQPLAFLPRDQIGGHCGWESAKRALEAAMILKKLNTENLSHLSKNNGLKALWSKEVDFDTWQRDDRKNSLHSLAFNNMTLIDKQETLLQIISRVKAWNDKILLKEIELLFQVNL